MQHTPHLWLTSSSLIQLTADASIDSLSESSTEDCLLCGCCRGPRSTEDWPLAVLATSSSSSEEELLATSGALREILEPVSNDIQKMQQKLLLQLTSQENLVSKGSNEFRVDYSHQQDNRTGPPGYFLWGRWKEDTGSVQSRLMGVACEEPLIGGCVQKVKK